MAIMTDRDADGRQEKDLSARSSRLSVLNQALTWFGLVAGSAVTAYAYSWAATHPEQPVVFHLFWVGQLLFILPAAVRLLGRDASRGERLAILVAMALFEFLPKLLRNPSAPLFHDEMAHWRQAESIYTAGQPFLYNPLIQIARYFPGLETATVALRHLTGLSTFRVGTILIAVVHVASVMGVYFIVERLTRSSRSACLAALFYAFNPAFMFFDSQYSYESLAVGFFVWVIACVVGFHSMTSERRPPLTWIVAGSILAAGLIVTHHLTTYILVVALVIITAVTVVRSIRHRESRRTAWFTGVFTTLVAAGAAAWLLLVASGTIGYLGPSLTRGLGQFMNLLRHEQRARVLFAQSVVPVYEKWATFATPVLLFAGSCLGIWGLWRNRRRAPPSSARLGLALFGLLYFLSVPLMLTQSGSEGARRTWTFTYLGLAVLIAPAVIRLLELAPRRWRPRVRGLGRVLLLGGLAAALVVILIGNVTVQVNTAYRFPGPFVYGSDTRSLTPELIAAANWARQTLGPGNRFVTDRDGGLAMGSFGDQNLATPSQGFPTWELYFKTGLPSQRLFGELSSSHYQYLLIDLEMSRSVPLVGVYFEPDEPQGGTRVSPPSAAALQKYDGLPWVTKVYASDNWEIYSFDFATVRACPAVPSVPLSLLPGCRGAP